MKRFLKRIHKGNKGFTLMEILIVVAILGILAAVIVPNLTGLIGHSETKAAAVELSSVQSAMDAMMAKEELTSFTSTHVDVANATNDMTKFPNTTNPLSTYLRSDTSKGTYYTTTAGVVSQASTGY